MDSRNRRFLLLSQVGGTIGQGRRGRSSTSDLTWRDVAASGKDSLLIRIKQPKTGTKDGEYIDLFSFKGYGCCPIKALYALHRKQVEAGIFKQDSPVFRFCSKKNLTGSRLNRVLGDLLSNICTKGENAITCDSFRAGIPSCLISFPDLATNDDIKGWGRWQSDCYKRYTRMKLPQLMKIFDKISAPLQASQPSH
jgi:hypothetical protein